ncbi:unnamed protein product [Calypogeia fissa]
MTPTFAAGQSIVKGGYYVGGSSKLLPTSGLDASLFTHLFYAFANLADNSPKVVMPSNNAQEVSTFSSNMKSKNPDVLTLLSIQATGAELAVVLQNNQTRGNFISSSITLARSYQFDGIDLDWEFARSQTEMNVFGVLIAEWRHAVSVEGQNTNRTALLLTAAVYFNSTIIYAGKGSYPIGAIADNLDFVNVMSYDYHGSWQPSETGANTNLYDNSSLVSTDRGITSWLQAGMPPKKLVLGLTLYGRSWTLKDENIANGLGAAAVGLGPAQPVSNTAGIFYYSEVVSFIANDNATVVHDMTEVTGYCYAQNIWVSYEDPFIIGNKVLYSKSKDLRGYFFWQVSGDNNFQVSAAASQTMDTGIIPLTPASPSSAAAPTASLSTLWVAVAVLLLLRGSTIDTVG